MRPSPKSSDALARLRRVGQLEHRDGGVRRAGREHHPLARAEAHLTWLEIGEQGYLLADQCLGFVALGDPRENLSPTEGADVQSELQQLARSFDRLAIDDLRHAKVEPAKVV